MTVEPGASAGGSPHPRSVRPRGRTRPRRRLSAGAAAAPGGSEERPERAGGGVAPAVEERPPRPGGPIDLHGVLEVRLERGGELPRELLVQDDEVALGVVPERPEVQVRGS